MDATQSHFDADILKALLCFQNQKQPGLQRSGGKRKSASSPHGGAAEDFQVASNGKNETRKQCLKDVTEIKEQENHPVVFSSNNEGRNADKEESNMAECDSEVIFA